MLSRLSAIASTIGIEPGEETRDADGVHVRGRVFIDRVESSDRALDGTNRVTLDVDVQPTGTGALRGTFELTLTAGNASWIGALEGRFENGLVVAEGVARGVGAFANEALHLSYRQLPEHPGTPPIKAPLAVFEMKGLQLSPRASSGSLA